MIESADKSTEILHCSFCNKSQREVKKLIAGPTVFICDGCVDICSDIMSEDREREKANRIFIVHGHDEAALHKTARFFEKSKLEVVVLRERPNAGNTLIEKLIEHSSVSFAVVLLTADDRGGVQLLAFDEQNPRARQNVILELGYFIGRLGRKRVVVLYRPGVEIPSDYLGVLYIPFDASGAWRLPLARELKNAGVEIDLNKIV